MNQSGVHGKKDLGVVGARVADQGMQDRSNHGEGQKGRNLGNVITFHRMVTVSLCYWLEVIENASAFRLILGYIVEPLISEEKRGGETGLLRNIITFVSEGKTPVGDQVDVPGRQLLLGCGTQERGQDWRCQLGSHHCMDIHGCHCCR